MLCISTTNRFNIESSIIHNAIKIKCIFLKFVLTAVASFYIIMTVIYLLSFFCETFRAGGHMATIKDVARLAGVSISTVSKYLNGGNVRPEYASSVQRAISQLDYHANPYARSLKIARAKSIGVLLPSMTLDFFGNIVTAMDKVLRGRCRGLQRVRTALHRSRRECAAALRSSTRSPHGGRSNRPCDPCAYRGVRRSYS